MLYFDFFDSSGAKEAKHQYPSERKEASQSTSNSEAMERKSKLDELQQSSRTNGTWKMKKARKNMRASGKNEFE